MKFMIKIQENQLFLYRSITQYKLLHQSYIHQQTMQYSFSQTFGRNTHPNIFRQCQNQQQTHIHEDHTRNINQDDSPLGLSKFPPLFNDNQEVYCNVLTNINHDTNQNTGKIVKVSLQQKQSRTSTNNKNLQGYQIRDFDSICFEAEDKENMIKQNYNYNYERKQKSIENQIKKSSLNTPKFRKDTISYEEKNYQEKQSERNKNIRYKQKKDPVDQLSYKVKNLLEALRKQNTAERVISSNNKNVRSQGPYQPQPIDKDRKHKSFTKLPSYTNTQSYSKSNYVNKSVNKSVNSSLIVGNAPKPKEIHCSLDFPKSENIKKYQKFDSRSYLQNIKDTDNKMQLLCKLNTLNSYCQQSSIIGQSMDTVKSRFSGKSINYQKENKEKTQNYAAKGHHKLLRNPNTYLQERSQGKYQDNKDYEESGRISNKIRTIQSQYSNDDFSEVSSCNQYQPTRIYYDNTAECRTQKQRQYKNFQKNKEYSQREYQAERKQAQIFSSKCQKATKEKENSKNCSFSDKIKKISNKIDDYQQKVTKDLKVQYNFGKKKMLEQLQAKSSIHKADKPKGQLFRQSHSQKTTSSTKYQKKQQLSERIDLRNTGKVYHDGSTETRIMLKSQNFNNDTARNTHENFTNIFKSTDRDGMVKVRLAIQQLKLPHIGIEIVRQLTLDQELRKTKKQFTKIPTQLQLTQNSFNKWTVLKSQLSNRLKQQNMINDYKHLLDNQEALEHLFTLTDDQADPFYSITIQNNPQFIIEIIIALVQSFILAENNYQKKIVHCFEKQELSTSLMCLIKKTKQPKKQKNDESSIKLNQFIIAINQLTKSNYKIRDGYLLYCRLKGQEDILDVNMLYRNMLK